MHGHKGQRQPDERNLRMRHDACRRFAADARMQITIELQKTIGNSANIPEANEPMLWLAVVTITTTVAAATARSGMS